MPMTATPPGFCVHTERQSFQRQRLMMAWVGSTRADSGQAFSYHPKTSANTSSQIVGTSTKHVPSSMATIFHSCLP